MTKATPTPPAGGAACSDAGLAPRGGVARAVRRRRARHRRSGSGRRRPAPRGVRTATMSNAASGVAALASVTRSNPPLAAVWSRQGTTGGRAGSAPMATTRPRNAARAEDRVRPAPCVLRVACRSPGSQRSRAPLLATMDRVERDRGVQPPQRRGRLLARMDHRGRRSGREHRVGHDVDRHEMGDVVNERGRAPHPPEMSAGIVHRLPRMTGRPMNGGAGAGRPETTVRGLPTPA